MLDIYATYFVVLCALLFVGLMRLMPSLVRAWYDSTDAHLKFQRQFLLVYLTATAADWVQGAYVYDLYAYYGFSQSDIRSLFIGGYLSAWLLGSFCGPYADVYGRKKACIAYCVIYSLSCLTKHSRRFAVLLLGRVLGGIATSLLWSAFESWLVSKHNTCEFGEHKLSSLFSIMSFTNGIVAVLSGLAAQAVVTEGGGNPVLAFDLAIAFSIVCCVLIVFILTENYGDEDNSISNHVVSSLRIIYRNPCVLWTGIMQVCFESAMYIFIFVWTPTLRSYSTTTPPLGLIFAVLMLACSLGGVLYKLMQCKTIEIMPYIFLISALSMLLPCVAASAGLTMFSFVMFEIVVGVYLPNVSVLRSIYIPEAHRATITNVFRTVLNAIVCGVLLFLGSKRSLSSMYKVCAALQVTGIATAFMLHRAAEQEIILSEGTLTPLIEDSSIDGKTIETRIESG